MLKALLIDVDGTLLKSDRTISDAVVAALQRLRDKGFIVALSTGRQFPVLNYVFDRIGHQGLHIVSGGGQVVDAGNNSVVWENSISSDDAKWLVEEMKNLGSDPIVGKQDALYGYPEFVESAKSHPWKIPVKLMSELGDDWSSPLITVHQINEESAQFLENQDRLQVVKMFASRSGHTYYDVTAKGVTKIDGIEKWAELNKVKLSEIAGVGDGANDVEFLQAVGKSFAMANSIDEVMSVADVIVGSNEEDGVAEVASAILNL